MKIISLSFSDKSREWTLNNMFFNKLTLLVGASGVGKTQILRALVSLKEIAEGNSLNGVSWNVLFETNDSNIYLWEGEFETNENGEDKSKIWYEKLFLNEKLIVDRNSKSIIFNEIETIKLSQKESIIHLLQEEDTIKEACNSILKIHFSNQFGVAENKELDFDAIKSDLIAKFDSLKKIQESDFHYFVKLFLIELADNKHFNIIKQRFIDIFPTVEDLRFFVSLEPNPLKYNVTKKIVFKIKEYRVDKWIPASNISWGMMRTLKHLSELYLCSEGTVFLIDEFENSLGINCINEITADLLKTRRQLQFILTSHHPYIINSIHYNNWKLVTRNAGVINTHDVAKFNIGKSKHDAFMQLIQLEEYQTGTEQL